MASHPCRCEQDRQKRRNRQLFFPYIFDGKNRVSTVSTLEFPHSNFAVYVLFTSSHGTGLLRVAASQVEGYPGAATPGCTSTLYHHSIKSIRARDPTVADSPASTFCIYSSFWLLLTEKIVANTEFVYMSYVSMWNLSFLWSVSSDIGAPRPENLNIWGYNIHCKERHGNNYLLDPSGNQRCLETPTFMSRISPRHLWLPEDYHPYPYHNPHSSWFNMVESIPIPKQISWSSIFIMVKFLLINGYIHLNPIISRLSMVDFLWINAWSLLKSTAKKTGRWDPLRRWWSCQCPAANWFGLMWCVFFASDTMLFRGRQLF